MPGAPAPQTLLEAIAADAGPTFITSPMPEAPTGTLAASIQGGYPPIVMTNELAGGKPPLGQDMNGFLFLLSSHTLWVECGQLYLYNSDLATAIGGYLAGTVLGMSDGTGMWLNRTNGNTTNPDAGGAGWVPMAAYGRAAVSGLTGGTVNLTAAQSKYGVVVLTGALTSNLTINFPQTVQEWLVINGTSGAFTTTAKTAAVGSVGVTVPQGGFSAPLGVYSVGDGNLYPTVAPLSVPIDQNPTPLTLVERTNAGYVLATYFNQSSGIEVPGIGAVFVQSTNNDGFLRKISLTNFEAQILLQGLSGQLVNGQVPYSVVSQWSSTLFTNAALTGVPTAPTAGLGVSNTQIATTAFANPGVTVNGNGTAIKLPNGYILQYGSLHIGDVVAPQAGTLNLPIVFPIAFENLEITAGDANILANGPTYIAGGTINNTSQFSWGAREITSAIQNATIYWRAIGR
jgi:hypothetical protein